MQRQRSLLALILVLLIAAIVVIVRIPPRLGLDLRGGSQLTVQVKTTEEVPEITSREMDAVQRVIEDRLNPQGVSEIVVQSAGNDQILVQLPGVNDPKEAEELLGRVAKLEFRKQKPGTEAQLQAEYRVLKELQLQQESLIKGNDQKAIEENKAAIQRSNAAIANLFEPTGLTGENLKDAFPQSTTSQTTWEVGLRFDTKGAALFADLTKNLAGTGRSIGIFLDNELISAPTVGPEFAQTGITGGSAVVTGNFTAQSATTLATQLYGGALPVPVEVVETRTVGATLGQDSIQSSIYAGVGGLVLVLTFMVLYYRLPGVIADISLIIYALLTFAAFNLLGVTLTLPGIAGFILSIGMAVDANVLIFERTREELRAGKTLYRSVEAGFYRAFSSILDSNVTTLIACGALAYLGTSFVRGFAVTLSVGVLTSMFTALTCSRTLLLFVLSFSALRKPGYFCPNLSSTQPQPEATP
ncbi:protein translocase subunit SecD [Leptothermofonsia sichuanensis E412]|uniref:protein translocase subunit SecD n=1 Tax=Leptothermofonsia sichuanensis TaxID=2917832 RepID=UPI001CA6E922|nr:protein translocase subunit SecD [Leptothermofonsia sichuanensis]QZZ22586.1 protein translocase subunit SecD [Leptothermofonsia sichuanensis E412]